MCMGSAGVRGKYDKNENDIPMQKTACRDFASSQQDWTILKEFSEKGISGYKVSADDRDAIQELKEAALNNEFDIPLVFMLDRIGRIDDETPFVVDWFAKHGVEVWSTQEGQQCFNNHVDKLMNYLRFWQASGESEKTSIRIKSKMQQMTLDGLYTGGPVKFGYRLVDSGLVNWKGAKVKKYEIDPTNSEVLHMIDEMTIHKGYGSYRMADFLNKKGHKPSGGGKFTSIKVIRILRDSFYCGKLEDGSTSPQLEALRLRSDDTYDQILYILEQRQNKNEEKRHIALQTKGQAMLSGNVFCAHCGGRLTTIRYRDSYTRADGTEYSWTRSSIPVTTRAASAVSVTGRRPIRRTGWTRSSGRLSERYLAAWMGRRRKKSCRRCSSGRWPGTGPRRRSWIWSLRRIRSSSPGCSLKSQRR